MKLVFLFSCLALVSCIEVRDVKDKQPDSTSTDSKISYQIEPLAQAQTYLVKFSGLDCQAQFRKVNPLKKVETGPLQQCSHVVKEAGIHEYSFQEITLQVHIPEDLVIENKVYLSQLPVEKLNSLGELKFQLSVKGRIFFNRGSQLITEGKNVLIDADLIESAGAEILSFELGQKASPTLTGKSGGLIKIKTPEIKGSLRFVLRGENGGDGENHLMLRKKIHELNLNGGHGGNSGRVNIEVGNVKNALIQTQIFPGAKGIGSEVKSSCFLIENCQPRLLRPKGNDGFDGMPERSCFIKNGICDKEILSEN